MIFTAEDSSKSSTPKDNQLALMLASTALVSRGKPPLDVRTLGLLSRPERQESNPESQFLGFQDGDGIYSAKSPLAFEATYGRSASWWQCWKEGLLCILTQNVLRACDPNDTLAVNRGTGKEFFVMESAGQVRPLFQFSIRVVVFSRTSETMFYDTGMLQVDGLRAYMLLRGTRRLGAQVVLEQRSNLPYRLNLDYLLFVSAPC